MSNEASAPAGDRRAILTVALCCLAAMGEGIDLQAPGVTLPVLGPLFKLSTGEGAGFVAGLLSQKSLFLSMSTFGLILGAIIGGWLSDRFGRKWVATVSVVLFGLMSAVTAHSNSTSMLLACRFATGLGLGGAMPNLIAMAAEAVGYHRRGAAIGWLYASLPLGGGLVSLAAFAWANPVRWPMIYYVGAVAPLVAAVGLIFGAPNHRPPRPDSAAPTPGLGKALFGDGRALRTVVLWIGFFFALIAMYILLGWLPSLLIGKGLARSQAAIVQLGFNLFGALGSALMGRLLDRKGRSLSIALVFMATIGALAVLAGAPATLAISFAVGCLVGFTLSGTQAILYGLAPSCYPMAVRGAGVGCAVAAGRLGSAVGPLLAGAMLGGGASASRVLAALVPIMAAAGVAAVFVSTLANAS